MIHSRSEAPDDAGVEGEGASGPAPDARALSAAFAADAHVHRLLENGGVLHLDRALPFLLVCRDRPEDAGTSSLPVTEASYLIVGRGGAALTEARELVRVLAESAVARFGAFLVLELWSDTREPAHFRVRGPAREAASTVQALVAGLGTIPLPAPAPVLLEHEGDRHPPGTSPLLDVRDAWRGGTLLLGLALPPLYRDPAGDVFPVFLRRFRAALSRVLRQTVADFVRVQTAAGVESYRALGPRHVGELAWRADETLALIEQTFDFLLLVAPMDAAQAWDRFAATGLDRTPEFHYRLLPFDPDLLKRRLYAVELERVEDPALAQLLRDKRDELDRQITLLGLRGTPAFRWGSQQLYGAVGEGLHRTALELLSATGDPALATAAEPVSAVAFAECAQQEVEAYRAQLPELRVDIQIRPDVTGLLVSRGRLLIGERLALSPGRVDALLQHEVGTHVLTYVNGAAQPLHQLRHGLAGYDELQEALGVLAEYLVGGLTRARLRILAARVVAAAAVESGAEFMETFRLLHREHALEAAVAFDVAERVHQSGGFTRDLIYLRGLVALLEQLRAGASLEPLYIGKLSAAHAELIADLRDRAVLRQPPLRPRFLERPDVQLRLQRLQQARGIRQLLEEAA